MRRLRAAHVVLVLLAFAIGPAAAADLDDFARCLQRAGATYYTASWCPHCARQEEMFGRAVRYLRSVDCSVGCAEVRSLPTWEFADGSRFAGVASFDVLSSRTGCRLGVAHRPTPSGHDDVARSWSGHGTRERWVGGARIIEVPAR